MKKKSIFSKLILLLLLVVLILPARKVYGAENDGADYNRYNVVIAMDASNSINYTDPQRLRDDAAEQFIGLLAEEGNVLGGVVFSGAVEESVDMSTLNTADDKTKVTDFFKGTQTYMYTNIGSALDASVNMIGEKGNADLPSVIVLLSDGNTEMETEEEQSAALELKAEALQEARDKGIKVYTVCLNANSKADTTEMQQIAGATGGVFEEVKDAADLKRVFNEFYDLIYGTATIELLDEVFPENGVLEKAFTVPGIGVEEVNIVVNGTTSGIALTKPNGSECGEDQLHITSAETFSLVKIRNVEPGEWKITVHGNPGDQIKVNMVYNTNLQVRVTGPTGGEAYADEESTILAQLAAGGLVADTREQYSGYSAVLELCDIDGNVQETVDMAAGDDGFTVNYTFGQGVYYYRVRVTGNYLEKTSELYGPLQITGPRPVDSEDTSEEQEPLVPVNNAPEPVEDRVQEIVYVWPFKGGSVTVDLGSLATDKEDKELVCKILSSSFIEGTDYTVDGNTLTQDHFSLSRGSYTVRAMDSGGLTCEVELEIITRNVGIMALIGIGIIALIVLIILGIGLYIALTKPFGGPIYVQGYMNGKYSDKVKREKRRGRCKLSLFGLDPSGLNYTQCYFQATGQNYIELVTKAPVYYSGRATNRVRIESGAETTVTVDQEGNKKIFIRFESRMRQRARGRSARGGAQRPRRK